MNTYYNCRYKQQAFKIIKLKNKNIYKLLLVCTHGGRFKIQYWGVEIRKYKFTFIRESFV